MHYIILLVVLTGSVLFAHGLAWVLGQTPAETAAWLALGGVIGHIVGDLT